ncbi:MAG: hypothetical protein II842_00230, partial [Butyrivibrio sp.]|nr:hypothetical protein [Butyrivibrio sp.]
QDMGRIKRVREFGDPDYIRIDQAVFKFNCCEDAVRSIAKQCDAQRKVNGSVFYDYAKLKRYFDLSPAN